MTDGGSHHHDPFGLGDEYIDPTQAEPEAGGENRWQQLHTSLRRDIAYRHRMRDAQDAADLVREFQNEITFMTRQLLALEANMDELRAAESRVAHAWAVRRDAMADDKAFGRRVGLARNIALGGGALCLIIWVAVGDVPGFVIWATILGLLAGAGMHALAVLGGGGLASAAERADVEWRERSADFDWLEDQVMNGIREPRPRPAGATGSRPAGTERPGSGVTLFPEPRSSSAPTGTEPDREPSV